MRLDGRVAVITGGGSGIGAATARAFAREGARVVIADIDETAGEAVAAEIAAELTATGATIDFLHADASDPTEIERVIGFATSTHGRLDVLHNNHVSFESGRVGDLTLEGFRRSLEVGLVSYWYAIKQALVPMVAAGRGSIVNTASVSGLAGDFGLGAYNVLKAGVVNLTRVTGIEYARKGVRCNAVCPGPIGTPPIERLHEAAPRIWSDIRDAIPMGRYGRAEEIANVVLFLASDESSFVTGSHIVADGGLWAHSGMPPIGGLGPDF
ncbi:SDR family NAD(P)-dependent oxidoreductase [Pseudonocardia humida]|uniref:SDR family oxidoreductase n=1 Tax=Pseudonocardia humida TaxID=2800819 RepID=A0ABT0ZZU4_9PSEU|nr:SDR family NAD(P)-dependent oxidoreductase [Pseudonocardia humida]MCO1656246.1 SDR family oxidoreductase [Pseudonocardia humida]